MKIINDWIKSGKNFFVGVAIYKTVGKNDQLKTLFSKGKTDFAVKTLEKELLAIINPVTPLKAVIPADTIPESNDSILESIRNAWLPKYQRMNYLRHELDKFKGNNAEMVVIRKDLAKEIMLLEKECMDHWDKADQYQKTGKLPVDHDPDEMVVPEDPLERAKAIENTKRNIRRNRQEMQKKPGNTRLPILYDQYKDFYFRLTGDHYQEINS